MNYELRIKNLRKRSGFTIVEVLTALVIIALITGFFYIIFISVSKTHALKTGASDLKNLLEEARLKTINSEEISQYGVYLDKSQNKAVLFKGGEFNAFNSQKENIFSEKIYISDVSLETENQEIVFERPEGKTDDFGQIIFSSSDDSKNIRVIIYPTGVIDILSSLKL